MLLTANSSHRLKTELNSHLSHLINYNSSTIHQKEHCNHAEPGRLSSLEGPSVIHVGQGAFFLSVCCRWEYKKKNPAILKKTFRHVFRAVALRKAFLSGFTTFPRDAAVASRRAARSHFFCSHSWRIFGTFSMFSYIKEGTVTQTFINVLRKFWSQQQSSNWLTYLKNLRRTNTRMHRHDAPKNREVTWWRTAAGCGGLAESHGSAVQHMPDILWSGPLCECRHNDAKPLAGMDHGGGKAYSERMPRYKIRLKFCSDTGGMWSIRVLICSQVRHVWNSRSLNSKSLKEKKNI